MGRDEEERRASSCSTASAAGTRSRRSGWDGSASAASSAELNRSSRERRRPATSTAREELRRFGPVAFVLALDADTDLPRGVAARLAATLAHPLNRAESSEDGRILAGYSVLQPRIEITPDSSGRTRYSRLFAGDSGLDLYSHACSDVYQDLFGIGIFAGKGIYDPAAFEASLAGRIPENALLSHDLFEGLHGRAALVSDVMLFEDFPPTCWPRCRGSTAGCAATGSSCPGSCRACRPRAVDGLLIESRTDCPGSAAG